jgi:hypothetical protein
MTQLSTLEKQGLQKQGFGATERRDPWWIGPALTFAGLSAFLIYGTWAAFQGDYFEIRNDKSYFHRPLNPVVAPYLSPFYAPLIYDLQSPHAWFVTDRPSWWPAFIPITPALLILPFPGLFRFTCYYYRKAYYRAFWADPPGCAVGEPRKTYWGENRLPLILQNLHRYFMYIALIFLVLLTWDALLAFRWPTLDEFGNPTGRHQFGIGLGTLIMVANVVCLAGFTFGCNSARHLVGGRLKCFSCTGRTGETNLGYKMWRCSTALNEKHMEWAWISLFVVGFTDLYIRLCAMGVWSDLRIV